MIQKKSAIDKHAAELQQSKKHILLNLWFIIVVFAAVTGYAAGVYHYQIEAAIGPVFGYKAHQGEIDLSTVQQTYNKLAANYDGELDIKQLIWGANRGLVEAAGDPYTAYMSPSESKDFNDSLHSNIGGGIGAEIGQRNNKITIIRVLKGNPAEGAGLLSGDIILKINDQSTSDWSVDEAVNKIRGDEGTTVKLSVQRGDETLGYNITRAVVNNPSVYSSIKDGIGTMTVTRFDDQDTGRISRQIAQDFKDQGVKAVILDLRDNGGGHVSAAVDLAGLWLDNKILLTEKTGNKIVKTDKTGRDAILSGVPTVVLVNNNSASASEIVAGALKDYKVAKLVGEKTFGKGSVQQLVPLDSEAQLKVTIARWYTPKGKNITKDGIVPDKTVKLTQKDIEAGADPQLDAAKELLSL